MWLYHTCGVTSLRGKNFFFLFSVFLTVKVITDIEDRLEPVSQVDLLVDSFLRGRDLLFLLSWPPSNMVLSSSTEKDSSELRRETWDSRDDLSYI